MLTLENEKGAGFCQAHEAASQERESPTKESDPAAAQNKHFYFVRDAALLKLRCKKFGRRKW